MESDSLVLGISKKLNSIHAKNKIEPELESLGTWDHESLAQIRIKVFKGHREACTSCQFCGFNEEHLLTAGEDACIKLWDFPSGNCLHTYIGGHHMSVTKARAGPDNRSMVSSGWDKKVNVWDLETGKVLWTGHHEGIVTCCNYSHDGKYVVSGSDFDNSIKVWDAFNGELIAHVENFHQSTVTSCMFNPHDDRIVTTSMDMSTKFYDLKTRCNTITLKNHINIVSDAAFTTDERKLATVSWDKSIAFYDISTGMYRSEGPKMQEKAHEGCVSCCDFTEDGLTLATGGYDMCVCLWDVENNAETLKLQGHTDWIEDVVISKNGNWLMTASRDKTVRVWNIENADSIPMVQEKKKNIGLSMFKCTKCGKPFSLSEDDLPGDNQLCVFCRLEQVQMRDSLLNARQA